MTGTTGSSYCVGPDTAPDKYRLLQHVGGGGEAQLWQAELYVAGGAEPVAVKILRPEHLGDFDRLSERWRDQAELLRFVRNPGVVGVREHFEGAPYHLPGTTEEVTGRSLYLVMNWVEGLPLREWLWMNRDPVERTARVLRHLEQSADVLDWLHSDQATPTKRPVIHGDLSPGNIMITPTGQAMLVDFGLVRVVSHRTADAAGTPGYAAPEVWTSGEYSPASDRYSFGAVAYFALTGSAPSLDRGDIRAGLAAHHLIADAPPANLDRLMSIFSEQPADRPAATEWVRLLRNTATTTAPTTKHGPVTPRPVPTPAPPNPSRTERVARKVGWAAAALLVAVAGGALLGATLLGGGSDAGADTALPATEPSALVSVAPSPTTRSVAPTTSEAAAREAAASPTSPPTVAELDPTDVTIRRQSGDRPLQFSAGFNVDLDSQADNWDVSDSHDDRDLENLNSGDVLSAGNDVIFARVGGVPDFAECARSTVLFETVDLTAIDADTSFCVQTSGGRYAWVTVLDPAQPVTLDVTVWDPPVRVD